MLSILLAEGGKRASSLLRELFCFLPHLWVAIVGISLFQLAIGPNIEAHNAQRFIQFGLFGFSLLLVLLLFSTSRLRFSVCRVNKNHQNLSFLVLTFIFFGAGGSIIGSKYPVLAIWDLGYLALLVGMSWVLTLSFYWFSNNIWASFGKAVVLAMVLFIVRCFLEILVAFPISNKLSVTPGFSNIRTFANLAVIFIPFSWLALLNSPRAVTRVAVWLVSVLWLWVLVFTEARSGILSLVVGGVWVAFRYGAVGRRLLFRFCFFLFVGWALYFFIPVQATSGWTRDVTSSSGRWELWSVSWGYFLERFPFGIGGMMYAADGRLAHSNPHNVFFTMMAEWGFLVVFGLVLFLGWAFFATRKFSKSNLTPAPIKVILTWALIAGLVNLQFSGAHLGSFSSIALVLAFGAYFSVFLPILETPEKNLARHSGVFFILVVLFFIWLFISLFGYRLYGFSQASRQQCLEESSGILYPRVWVQGRLDCGGIDARL